MNLLGKAVLVGLVVGLWAQVNELRPPCDSPEAEEAAIVAQDYLNAQHTHFYKYALNKIEEIKIRKMVNGDDIFLLEVELLETDCHVLDPTPVANCTVRPKHLTSIEGDCDVVLKRVAGALTVTAFKCKTEESAEDICLGCHTLLPLNHTMALDFVQASLTKFNNRTENTSFTLLDVGRMSSQIVAGGAKYAAEFAIIEANCINDTCTALNDTMAARGFCSAEGLSMDPTVDCRIFSTLMPILDANSTAVAEPALPTLLHTHLGSSSPKHGLRHHKLTALHDPHLSNLLSAESDESDELTPVSPNATAALTAAVTAASTAASLTESYSGEDSVEVPITKSGDDSVEVPITKVKRDVPAPIVDTPVAQTGPVSLVPVCPGRVRFF